MFTVSDKYRSSYDIHQRNTKSQTLYKRLTNSDLRKCDIYVNTTFFALEHLNTIIVSNKIRDKNLETIFHKTHVNKSKQ
ncbi:hypothetical protein C5749_11295 [Sphingobacterium gobiense]|uniref:Uncharacterized protein n=1 Tax=Sphingobacterium gobiense TaxID=1382456 RepID=A0A2S9JLP9_9SPHI|nr:hypothetical protein C5749_11295 [Sphingobacterium gobiense]